MIKNSLFRGLPKAIVLATLGVLFASATWAADPVVDALVKFKEDISLPAKEPGVLIRLGVKEGDEVKKDQEIGQIDDSQAQMQKKAARYSRDGAVQRASDDVEIRFSKAQAAVAEKDYEKLLETNRKAPGAVPAVEERRAKLDWDRAVLAIEKSGKDQMLAKFEAWTKQAEFEAADLAILRRKIIAPFDGEIVEIEQKQDEWVNPGDPILRLARRDVMHIEGTVGQRDFDPHEVKGAQVAVEVQLARGRTETVTGKIIYVSPVLSSNDRFLVRAEVENRQLGGNWILMDGQKARMTIRTGANVAPAVSRKP
jgi:multidrug efflux pump subunit AcrA (membrane-fusion protein)